MTWMSRDSRWVGGRERIMDMHIICLASGLGYQALVCRQNLRNDCVWKQIDVRWRGTRWVASSTCHTVVAYFHIYATYRPTTGHKVSVWRAEHGLRTCWTVSEWNELILPRFCSEIVSLINVFEYKSALEWRRKEEWERLSWTLGFWFGNRLLWAHWLEEANEWLWQSSSNWLSEFVDQQN